MPWVLQVRPYLKQAIVAHNGIPSLHIDAVLNPGDLGMSILHQMIDALRREANGRLRNPRAYEAAHAVPWEQILRLPGVGEFANHAVPLGPAHGKTPLCLLANQCMPGQECHTASQAI